MEIADLIDAATSADHLRPHPNIVDAVLGELPSTAAAPVIAVGDTPYDAQAAGKEGLATIGLFCGGFPKASLSEAGCVAIDRDPHDLLDGFERSPLVLGPAPIDR